MVFLITYVLCDLKTNLYHIWRGWYRMKLSEKLYLHSLDDISIKINPAIIKNVWISPPQTASYHCFHSYLMSHDTTKGEISSNPYFLWPCHWIDILSQNVTSASKCAWHIKIIMNDASWMILLGNSFVLTSVMFLWNENPWLLVNRDTYVMQTRQ